MFSLKKVLKYQKVFLTFFKAAFFIGLAVMIYSFGAGWIEKFRPSKISVDEIKRIAVNVMELHRSEDDARFEEMKRQFGDMLVVKLAREAERNGAEIEKIGQIVAGLKISFTESGPAEIYKDATEDSRSYMRFDLERDMPDGEKMPVGWLNYHPATGDSVQFHYPLKYLATVVSGKDEDGLDLTQVQVEVENDYLQDYRGKRFPLELDDLKFQVRNADSQNNKGAFAFDPDLGFHFGASAGVGVYGGIDLNIWKWKNLRFPVLAVSSFKDDEGWNLVGSVMPLQYNLAALIPGGLINNLYIGPTWSMDVRGGSGPGAVMALLF